MSATKPRLVSLRSPVAIQGAGTVILGVTVVRGDVTDAIDYALIEVRAAWSPEKCLWAKGDEDKPITLYVPAENVAAAQDLP